MEGGRGRSGASDLIDKFPTKRVKSCGRTCAIDLHSEDQYFLDEACHDTGPFGNLVCVKFPNFWTVNFCNFLKVKWFGNL